MDTEGLCRALILYQHENYCPKRAKQEPDDLTLHDVVFWHCL